MEVGKVEGFIISLKDLFLMKKIHHHSKQLQKALDGFIKIEIANEDGEYVSGMNEEDFNKFNQYLDILIKGSNKL